MALDIFAENVSHGLLFASVHAFILIYFLLVLRIAPDCCAPDFRATEPHLVNLLKGCASVLKTKSSRLTRDGSLKIK